MAVTKKHERLSAFRMEKGLQIGGTTATWVFGGNTISALGSGNAFPYTGIQTKTVNDVLREQSINGASFESVPIQKAITAALDSYNGNARYLGMDKLLYWMFGYEDGGSSPQSLGGGLYSHLFELDAHERECVAYRTEEQTAVDYDATDRKNRFMTLAVKEGPNDYRYPWILCSGFGFTSKAGEAVQFTTKAVGYREDRGNYSSSSWTFASGVASSDKVLMHHHLNLSYGPVGALIDLAVTDFSMNVEIPLTGEQDSESGLYISEPRLSGKYNVTLSITLARHSVDTYAQYRDSFQSGALKAVWSNSAGEEFGLYFPDVRIADGGSPDSSDIARLVLTFEVGDEPDAGNPFSSEIGSHDLIQHGPVFALIKNNNDTNEMRRE